MPCAIQCYAVTPAVYNLFYVQQGLAPSASHLERMMSVTPTFFNWEIRLTDSETLRRITIIEPEDVGGLWAWREKAAMYSIAPNRVHLEGEYVASMEDITYAPVIDNEHPYQQSFLSPEYFIVLFQHFTKMEYIFNRQALQAFTVELERWRDFCPEHQTYLVEMQEKLPYLKVIHGEQPLIGDVH